MEMKIKNKRGVLLTLVTVVLLVLMLAEVITYVYLNIDYANIGASGAVSASSFNFALTLNGDSSAFLHSSLALALNTLAYYEGARSGSYQIPNTANVIETLMYNGTLYGNNEIALMQGSTVLNFTNSIIMDAKTQDISLSITNSTLQVYQKNPYSINVTYVALAEINSSSGSFTYPINASYQFQLNGSLDLYTVENENNYTIRFAQSYPTAVVVGNDYAQSGSTSPFMFAYGPIIVEGNNIACSSIPSRFLNNNYILAEANSMLTPGSCGLGGLITDIANSATPNVPYLVYGSSSNVFNYLSTGTSLLLDGKGLTLLDISALQSAIHSGHYFNSSFAPSYIDWAQGNLSKRDQFGLFSFNLYNRQIPQFVLSNSNTYVYMTNTNAIFTSGAQHLSFSLWFISRAALSPSSSTDTGLMGENGLTNILGLDLKGSNIIFGADDGSCGKDYISSIPVNSEVTPYTWHNVVAIYNASGTNAIYLDGVKVNTGSNAVSPCSSSGGIMFNIGKGDSNDLYANGSISNVQLYGASLSTYQASKLYLDGIEGLPFSGNSLIGWWPLNGNLNDFGNAITIVYYPGNGYCLISSSETLSNNLFCSTLTINPGVTLTTNGFGIYVNNTITNHGTIAAGNSINGGGTGSTGGNGGSFTSSYAGSGGAGGSAGCTPAGGFGGNTIANGGIATATCNPGGAGSTPSAPVMSNLLIQSWYAHGMNNYLNAGGGGGGACDNSYGCSAPGGIGGGGGYGIYIQANNVINSGAINANGFAGQSYYGGSGGGGGGGVIVIAYGTTYTAGTDNVLAGNAGSGSVDGDPLGGKGGNGQLITYNYGLTPPILVCPKGSCGTSLQTATVSNQIYYRYLYGYTGDPIYDGSFYLGNQTNLMDGINNCGNINQCSNMSLPHLYLAQTNLTTIAANAVSEPSSLGLANAVIPNIAWFNGNGYVYAPVNSLLFNSPTSNSFTLSAWVYLDANTLGPLFDIMGCIPSAGCATTPFVSVSKNTIYGNIGGISGSYNVPSLNSWYNIALIYSGSGSSETIYVNGAITPLTGTGSYGGAGTATDYLTTNCGTTCTSPSGSNVLYGRIGDLKIYASALTANAISSLYLNDNSMTGNLIDSWSLSTPYNGLLNQTADSVNAINPAYVADLQGICSNSNMIINQCGVAYTQP